MFLLFSFCCFFIYLSFNTITFYRKVQFNNWNSKISAVEIIEASEMIVSLHQTFAHFQFERNYIKLLVDFETNTFTRTMNCTIIPTDIENLLNKIHRIISKWESNKSQCSVHMITWMEKHWLCEREKNPFNGVFTQN